jgi:hypothetical protein
VAVAVGLAAGCDVASLRRPQPSSVPISVQSPRAVELTAPLRYAVVFGTVGGFVVTADGPVTLGDTFPVPLRLPPAGWENSVTPLESVILPSHTSLDVYRPRLLVYEDLDQSGDFAPASQPNGVDRVVAVDNSVGVPSLGVVPNLDTVLANMTLEETAAYYEASGHRYTPFIRVQATSGYLELIEAATADPIRLDIADSPVPAERFVCGRSAVYLYGDPLTPATHVSIQVDSSLDAASVCGATIPACTSAVFAGMPAPDFSTLDTQAHRRVVQCRLTDRFQVVIIQDAELRCADCLCNYETTADAYFTAPSNVPDWWPCGTGGTVNYCDSTLPLYDIDAACVP